MISICFSFTMNNIQIMPQILQQNREREKNSKAFYLIKFKIEIKVEIFHFPFSILEFVQFWKKCEFEKEKKTHKNPHT